MTDRARLLIAEAHRTKTISDELVHLLEELLDIKRNLKCWRSYSDLEDWLADARVKLLSAVFRIDLDRTIKPETYLDAVIQNTLITKVKLYNNRMKRQKSASIIGSATHGLPDIDYTNFCPVTLLTPASLEAIPEGYKGLYRSPKRIVWVIARLSDIDED